MAESAADIKNKLEDLLKKRGVMTGAEWQQQRKEKSAVDSASGRKAVSRELPGQLEGDEDFGFQLIRQDFPLDTVHGVLNLGAVLESSGEHIALSAKDDELVDFDPRKTCFMDTETTGLSGGTGTIAFLVGVGYFHEDVFRLDQCFMRDYDDEEPMLQFLSERFSQCDTVVGYNSKSFDLPLLRTRFIQNRIPFHGEAMMHYDLVHASRRIWKKRLKDCSLGNIEREILNIRRKGDVPSHLIPQMWFDFLNTGNAHPLHGVFYHHEVDILSLVTLTAWLAQCLATPDGAGFDHDEDQLSLVRVFYNQKKYEEVITNGNAFLERTGESPLRRECFEMMGLGAKRLQRFEEMQRFLEHLLEEFPNDLQAHHELAKHHEHRTRDLYKARDLCANGCERALPGGVEEENLIHRFNRIEKKIKKVRGGVIEDDC